MKKKLGGGGKFCCCLFVVFVLTLIHTHHHSSSSESERTTNMLIDVCDVRNVSLWAPPEREREREREREYNMKRFLEKLILKESLSRDEARDCMSIVAKGTYSISCINNTIRALTPRATQAKPSRIRSPRFWCFSERKERHQMR